MLTYSNTKVSLTNWKNHLYIKQKQRKQMKEMIVYSYFKRLSKAFQQFRKRHIQRRYQIARISKFQYRFAIYDRYQALFRLKYYLYHRKMLKKKYMLSPAWQQLVYYGTGIQYAASRYSQLMNNSANVGGGGGGIGGKVTCRVIESRYAAKKYQQFLALRRWHR
jgi:hypothetical protein